MTDQKDAKNDPPTVVHIKRRNGEVVQGCDVYIGRACYRGGWELPQSIWHNPFPVGRDRDGMLKKYRMYLRGKKDLLEQLPELSGKVLGCWCKPLACHGDIIVEFYNEMRGGKQ